MTSCIKLTCNIMKIKNFLDDIFQCKTFDQFANKKKSNRERDIFTIKKACFEIIVKIIYRLLPFYFTMFQSMSR